MKLPKPILIMPLFIAILARGLLFLSCDLDLDPRA
jgi:hypothetical protein